MKFNVRIAAAMFPIALLMGCGSDVPQVAPGEGSAKGAAADDVDSEALEKNIETYFKALATNDPAQIESALGSAAAPGSIAEVYLKYQLAADNAYLDAGQPEEPGAADEKEDGWEYCDSAKRCITYADLKADGTKLASFTVDGTDIKERLLDGSGEVHSAGGFAEVEVLTSYQSVTSGDLVVTLRIKTADRTISSAYNSSYRSAEGRQAKPSRTVGPSELLANSTAYYAVLFPKAVLGGDFHLELTTTDGGYDSASIDVPLR